MISVAVLIMMAKTKATADKQRENKNEKKVIVLNSIIAANQNPPKEKAIQTRISYFYPIK